MIKSITEEMRNPQTLNLRQCEGLWVKMETYKLLLAQVDFLKSEYDESAKNVIGALESKNARLKAENEKLIKAGDSMLGCIENMRQHDPYIFDKFGAFRVCMKWLATKEGFLS